MGNNKFDGYEYFSKLCKKNRLAQKHSFQFCRVTGLGGMEEVLNNFRKVKTFFAVDETSDGSTVCVNGAFFKRRIYTIFLWYKYTLNDMNQQHEALCVCRTIYDQLCSKMLVDREILQGDLIYLNIDRIHFREMEKYFMNGCTGLYFVIDVDEPIDLSYNAEEWE